MDNVTHIEMPTGEHCPDCDAPVMLGREGDASSVTCDCSGYLVAS